MEFQWTTNEVSKDIVTLYNNNITLNKKASTYFEKVDYVLLGFDESNETIGIKPVFHDDINLQLYPKEQLHKISMGSSYARIANKSFIQQITSKYNINLEELNSVKFNASFDIVHQILLVNLKGGIL